MKRTSSQPHRTGSRDRGPLIMLGLTLLLGLALFLFGNGRGTGRSSGGDAAGIQSAGGSTAGAAAAAASPAVPALPPAPEGGIRIAVASDLHLDPDNTDHSGALIQASYNMELADALLRDAKQRGSGFYLENGERLAALLRAYGVPLYLSGHMHIQSVQQEEGLTELLTEYLLAYPTGYSVLDIGRDALRFTPVRIDVDGWAAETRQTDPVLLRFARWQSENLYRYCESAVSAMAFGSSLREDEVRSAAEFFYAVMTAYWDGTLAQAHDRLETMPGCQPFFRCAEGYSYGWWLRDLMETASPMIRGFTLSWPG